MIQEKQKGGSSIRWGTVVNLANSVKAQTLPQLTDVELYIEQKKARHKFYKLKRECGPLRSTQLEDKVAALNLKGKEKEAKKLNSKLANTRKREREGCTTQSHQTTRK
eukprot:1349407-Ditylum_brightwellii.AAC.1